MDSMFEGPVGERLQKALLYTVIVLAVFLGLKALGALQELRYIGAGLPATNTITVEGQGEVDSVPDTATFYFSIVSLKATVAAAQEDAAQKSNATVKYLTDAGVEQKDIKTSGYSVYPQYEYQQVSCITYPCPDGRQVLKGYEVRQSTTVKVRDTAKAGELLSGVGSRGATEVSGLEFTFDDPEGVEREARQEAIADAKEKAEELARQLGVRLVRVVSFSESGGGYPVPYYREAYGMGGDTAVKAVAPDISVGESKVTANVSVTYEIR